jgi:hypothetical protein
MGIENHLHVVKNKLMRALFSLLMGSFLVMPLLTACDMSSSKTCEQYRKGTFYYHFVDHDAVVQYTMIRNDSVQTETNMKTGNISKYKIHWINNCSYELHFLEGTEVLPRERLELKKGMVLRTTIISGTNSYYCFNSTSNLTDRVLNDTIWLKQ